MDQNNCMYKVRNRRERISGRAGEERTGDPAKEARNLPRRVLLRVNAEFTKPCVSPGGAVMDSR